VRGRICPPARPRLLPTPAAGFAPSGLVIGDAAGFAGGLGIGDAVGCADELGIGIGSRLRRLGSGSGSGAACGGWDRDRVRLRRVIAIAIAGTITGEAAGRADPITITGEAAGRALAITTVRPQAEPSACGYVKGLFLARAIVPACSAPSRPLRAGFAGAAARQPGLRLRARW
jgi:hypothetical protein